MSRRGRSGPTISLFSFQDIITSVTAIVTVITLLLALDLVQRKQSQASQSAAPMVAELIERLEQTEAEIARLKSLTATNDELIREVADTSTAELVQEIQRRKSIIAELEQEKARLEQLADVWARKEKESQADLFDLDPLKQELTRLEASTTQLQQQQTEEAAENRTIFSLPRGFDKQGWIVDVDIDQLIVAPIGRPAVPVVFAGKGGLLRSSAVVKFQKWIERENLSSDYFLLLVRPDAHEEHDLIEQLFSTKRISHGLDLIDADRVLFHPERGAAL